MGVDFSGNYGIGFKVNPPENSDDPIWDIEEIAEKFPMQTSCFRVGDSYTGETSIYLCVDDPFFMGAYQANKVASFVHYVKQSELEVEGEIDVVGGLHIY